MSISRWVNEIGRIPNDDEKITENGETEDLKCCCCDEENFISEEKAHDTIEGVVASDQSLFNHSSDDHPMKTEETKSTVSEPSKDFKEASEEEKQQQSKDHKEDASIEFFPAKGEGFDGENDRRLIPLLFIDSATAEDPFAYRLGKSNDQEAILGHVESDIELVLDSGLNVKQEEETAVADSEHEKRHGAKFEMIESMEIEEDENSIVLHVRKSEFAKKVSGQVAVSPATQAEDDLFEATTAEKAEEEKDPGVPAVYEELSQVQRDENKEGIFEQIQDHELSQVQCFENNEEPFIELEMDMTKKEVFEQIQAHESITLDNFQTSSVPKELSQVQCGENKEEILMGMEMPNEEDIEQIQAHEFDHEEGKEDPALNSTDDKNSATCDQGPRQAEKESFECEEKPVQLIEQGINNHLSLCQENNEIEEDRFPDTPTSLDGFHHLHKKLFLLEKRESEESLDGSVMSEFEGGEGVSDIEQLKSALKSERKALTAIYAELEEERSASAVAASQTMAMINRLQEEKAAMQMEALQYQRMMEEQSEYDQEALQLLNELLVKREKEKQELEKELEMYRKKVIEFEAKEKMMMLKRRKEDSTRSGTSSASCSNSEDSDGQSIDLNHEGNGEEIFDGNEESGHHNTPVDTVLDLEESLANFEEDRLSILEQLKILEEKLITLSDEEEEQSEVVKPIDHIFQENGKYHGENFDFSYEVNGNGFHEEANGKHIHERRIMSAKAKRLLPLFDAEAEDGILNGDENGCDSDLLQNPSFAKFEQENNRIVIEREVDHLYERLQALEADREFLRHCIGSLKKGDKGIELLQEILQHLRDLRNVDFRVRNMTDGPIV
ncbi:GTD-binding domain [Dillenia turbinata]|uniref:GTD-binding domain n=1 Tax=Dillenia turbinata TaxID=194707 RepID=A0AAN8V0W6_9MAGN